MNEASSISSGRRSLGEHLAVITSAGPRRRVLYATTFAFLMAFVVWFDMAPFAVAIGHQLHLTSQQLIALSLCNLVLAVPGRILIGRLVDRYGPRRLYGGLLMASAIPNTIFATAHSFAALAVSRLLVGVVGAGFVVGIRLVAEWYRDEDLGTAEGFYGGWGNFGSAAAALALPFIATSIASGPGAWRWGVFTAGAVAAVYGAAFLGLVRDTAEDRAYERPKATGALEVTSRAAVFGLVLLQLPVAGVTALVVERLHHAKVLSSGLTVGAFVAIACYLAYESTRVVTSNRQALRGTYSPDERYSMASVAILSCAYAVTFGTELTVVSLLPTFFANTFGLHIVAAGVAGSMFAFTNLMTRPAGGLVSDILRRRPVTIMLLLAGMAGSFLLLSTIHSSWPLFAGLGAVVVASIFVQGANGAIFAMVPAVKRRVGGQIAGIVGAYGNVGGLVLSSILYFTATSTNKAGDVRLVFLVIAVAATMVATMCRFLPDPDSAVRQAEQVVSLAKATDDAQVA